MPFFSVIIPLYNNQQTIAGTIECILAQHFTDFEIIIADDGSTDNSAAIVMQFEDDRVKYFFKENAGVSSARNYGMEQASGEYFAFIDADDYWYPIHLKELYDAIQLKPGLKVFTTQIEVESPYGIYVPKYTNLNEASIQEVDFFMASFVQTVLTTQSTAIHKSVPGTVGNFDTRLTICEDTDYWIRVGFVYKVCVVKKVTARHNCTPGSLTNTKFRMSRATFYEKFTELEKTNPAAKKMIDINRFSLALKCRLSGDMENAEKLIGMIAPENLHLKQRLLIKLNMRTLRNLLRVKDYLESKNIRLTAF